jgi:hypothetical protein
MEPAAKDFQRIEQRMQLLLAHDSGCSLPQRQYSSTAPANEETVSGGYA